MRQFDTINVIPFIDIILVLLTIVLMTATFVVQGQIEVQLPQTDSAAALVERQTLELVLDAQGQLYLDQRPTDDAQLQQRFSGLASDTPVQLRVDAHTPFERFAQVAALAQQFQLNNLAIVTESPR